MDLLDEKQAVNFCTTGRKPRLPDYMCKSLRYCFSHCLYLAMTRLEEVNRELEVKSTPGGGSSMAGQDDMCS